MDSVLYGIDFGTTTTYLAKSSPTSIAEIVPLGELFFLPSVAAFDGKKFYGGYEAQEMIDKKQAAEIASPKMSITQGRFTQLVTISGQSIEVELKDAIVAILKSVVDIAGSTLGIPELTKCAVNFGCPSSWDAKQRGILLASIQSAGFKNAILSDVREEAIAGGLAYLDRSDQDENGTIVVFDMGGGTLDTAILSTSRDQADSRSKKITVLASAGNDKAGDSLDAKIAGLILAKCKKSGIRYDEHEYQLNAIWPASSRVLRADARAVKESLSTAENSLSVPSESVNPTGQIQISRKELEKEFLEDLIAASRLVEELVSLASYRDSAEYLDVLANSDDFVASIGLPTFTTDKIGKGLEKNGERTFDELLKKSTIREEWLSQRHVALSGRAHTVESVGTVVLVGGMTKIPAVTKHVQALFPAATIVGPEYFRDNPTGVQGAVVLGLATSTPIEWEDVFRPPLEARLTWSGDNGQQQVSTLFEAYASVWDRFDRDNDEITSWDSFYPGVVSARQDFMIGRERYIQWHKPCLAELTFRRTDGKSVSILTKNGAGRLQGLITGQNSIRLHLGPHAPLTFKMYATGLIIIRDSNGTEISVRADWPEVWGPTKGQQVLTLEEVEVNDVVTVGRLGSDQQHEK